MRIVEILAALAAIGSIATFLGLRAMARKAVRSLARKPKPRELEDPREGIVGRPAERQDLERRE